MITILEQLISFPTETGWIEFKVDNSSPEMIGEKISALSNSAALRNKPFGYLVFGVEDKTHQIVGTSFNPLTTKKGNEELEHWIAQRLSPKIDFRIHIVEYQNKKISVFEIPANIDEPVKFKNIAYIRIGSITRKLIDFPEKERKIWNKTLSYNFEDNYAAKKLKQDEVLDFLNFTSYFELIGQKMPFNPNTIIEKFIQEEFVKEENNEFSITNLGAILFAKDLEKF